MDYQAILKRKLISLFPEADIRQSVLSMLESYGADENDREPDRVRVAILKLSAGDAKKLQAYLDTAKIDYRDVLAMAEFPRQLNSTSFIYDDKKQILIDKDLADYKSWLAE